MHEKNLNGDGYLVVHDESGEMVFRSEARFNHGMWCAQIDYDTFVDHLAPDAYFTQSPIQLISVSTIESSG